jgi:hypothetical protein
MSSSVLQFELAEEEVADFIVENEEKLLESL